MNEYYLSPGRVVEINSCTETKPLSFNDPAHFGYPDAFPGQVVDLPPIGHSTTCTIRLHRHEVEPIAKVLGEDNRLAILCGPTRIIGCWKLECQANEYTLSGEVESVSEVI